MTEDETTEAPDEPHDDDDTGSVLSTTYSVQPRARGYVRIAAAPSRLWPRVDDVEAAARAWFDALIQTIGLPPQSRPTRHIAATISQLRAMVGRMAATIEDDAMREDALGAFEAAVGGDDIAADPYVGLVRGLVISAVWAANSGGPTSMNVATAEVWLKHSKFTATLACETWRTALPARRMGRERRRLVEVCPACGA